MVCNVGEELDDVARREELVTDGKLTAVTGCLDFRPQLSPLLIAKARAACVARWIRFLVSLSTAVFPQTRQELWNLVVYDVPQDLVIDSEVCMRQNIAQTCDSAPFNTWHVMSRLIGYTLCCLADNLQVTHHRIIGPIVGEKGGAIHPGSVTLHLLTAHLNIVKI
jgi:hypothetical protein